jgi:hypothetical protein
LAGLGFSTYNKKFRGFAGFGTVYENRMEWTDKKTTRLIELYEANSTLYDVQDKNYHNRIKKRIILEKIAAELAVNGS